MAEPFTVSRFGFRAEVHPESLVIVTGALIRRRQVIPLRQIASVTHEPIGGRVVIRKTDDTTTRLPIGLRAADFVTALTEAMARRG